LIVVERFPAVLSVSTTNANVGATVVAFSGNWEKSKIAVFVAKPSQLNPTTISAPPGVNVLVAVR